MTSLIGTSRIEGMPVEILDVIVMSTDSANKPVLSAVDFGNLRACSRTLEHNTKETFSNQAQAYTLSRQSTTLARCCQNR